MTTPETQAPLKAVEVTQADRDAAAAHHKATMTPGVGSVLAEAFARHRLNTRATAAEDDVERVAWMAALAALKWDRNPSLVAAAEAVRADGFNNRAGHLSSYMCGRLFDAYDAARAAIAALSQPAPKEAVGERGWLIETDFGPHIHYIGLHDPHDYWREQTEKGGRTNGRAALVGLIRFCRDASDAIRFARPQDAQQLVDALGRLLTEPRICEHEWPVSTEPAPTIQPSAEGLAGEQVHGVTREPTYGEWCRNPALCAGKGYCPRDPSCGD
jgi:hypothetical protein